MRRACLAFFLPLLALIAWATTSTAAPDEEDRMRALEQKAEENKVFWTGLTTEVIRQFGPGEPNPPFQGEPPEEPFVNDVIGRYGGTFVLTTAGDLGTLNPLLTRGATDQEVRNLTFPALVGYDNERWGNNYQIASSHERSDDWLTWTFRIRRGLRWSDGQPLDADDVVFTFRVAFDAAIPSGIRDEFTIPGHGLPTVEKIDDHTVRFPLDAVDVLFLDHVGNVSIIPEHKWRTAYEAGEFEQVMQIGMPLEDLVCSGPFRLVEYTSAERIKFERNPYYFAVDREGNRLPYLDEVIIRIVPDVNTMYLKFKTGESHVLEPIRPEDFQDAMSEAEERGYTVESLGLSLNTSYIAFNRQEGNNAEGRPLVAPHKLRWFQNRDFRRAMSHAIDRDAIVRSVLHGRGAAIYRHITPSNALWYSETGPTFPYDLARARELLDSIGLSDRDGDGVREDEQGHPVEFTIFTNVENQTRIQIGNMIADSLRQIGVNATLTPMVFNSLITELRDLHTYEAYILGWASGVPPDPLQSKNSYLSSGELHPGWPQQDHPHAEWEARVDALVAQMSQEPVLERRRLLCGEIDRIWCEELPEIYTVSANSYVAAYNSVGNFKPSLLRPQTWWNIEQIYLIPED